MDKSMKYYEVLMVRRNCEFFRKYKLPDGYIIKPYKEGMEKEWAKLETKVGVFNDLDKAEVYFKEKFIDRKDVAQSSNIQIDFTMLEKEALLNTIKDLDVMVMTPLDAMNTLFKIVQDAKKIM